MPKSFVDVAWFKDLKLFVIQIDFDHTSICCARSYHLWTLYNLILRHQTEVGRFLEFLKCWDIMKSWYLQTLRSYRTELEEDPIIRAHLDSLYDNMLEQNLCRIIEPYSRVQVCFIFMGLFHGMSAWDIYYEHTNALPTDLFGF